MSINALYKELAKEYSDVLTTDTRKFLFALAKISIKQHKKKFNEMKKQSRQYKHYTLVKGRVK